MGHSRTNKNKPSNQKTDRLKKVNKALTTQYHKPIKYEINA